MAWCLPGGEQCRGTTQVSIRRGRRAIHWPRCPQVLTATASHFFVSDPFQG